MDSPSDLQETSKPGALAQRAAGLSSEEAARRLEARGETRAAASSRSYGSIVRANLLTVFNAILAAFGALTLAFGDWRDALFLGILVVNTGIGIAQEVRSKRTLDRLAALVAPAARAIRDGTELELPVAEVVVGDAVAARAGDQVVADGRVLTSAGALLDESVLTGESEPVTRGPGDEVRSGSFVVEGAIAYEVTAVGPDSYAERVAGVARGFRHPRSPLERSLNALLLWLVAGMVPLAAALGISLAVRDVSLTDAVSTATAAVVSLIPEGLILLASLTFAAASIRMAGRGALVQQLNAVESLASVDVICTDKTGTLTESRLRVAGLVAADGDTDALGAALARVAAGGSSRNATSEAIAAAYAAPPLAPEAEVPFSSRRRWSAQRYDGAWDVLGAPELFELPPELRERAAAETGRGRRVLCLARTTAGLTRDSDLAEVRPEPLGLVTLAERLRDETRATVEYLRSEGVDLKVLSGDAPATVHGIAVDAGIPARAAALDGQDLPEDPAELRRALSGAAVVGRISPEGKRRVVEALRDDGRYVAMIGDGVNDVPALKAARLAIAQGSGAQMARSVADVVLVSGDFASVPPMVAEGRQILRNVQRVARLFLTKSVFAAVLIVTIGVSALAYPFLPRHFSLAASLTIGIPSFLLALAPSSGRYELRGFVRSAARFAVPSGVAAAAGVSAAYVTALDALGRSHLASRTVSTTALVGFGLVLLLDMEHESGERHGPWMTVLAAAMAVLYAVALALPAGRDFFELAVPTPAIVGLGLAGAAVAVVLGRLLRRAAAKLMPG